MDFPANKTFSLTCNPTNNVTLSFFLFKWEKKITKQMLNWLPFRQKTCTAYFSVINPILSFLFQAWAMISGILAKHISGSHTVIDRWVCRNLIDASRSWAHAFSLDFYFWCFMLYGERIPANHTPPTNQRLLFHKWHQNPQWHCVQPHCFSPEVHPCTSCFLSAPFPTCCSFWIWCGSAEANWEGSDWLQWELDHALES